MAQYKNGFKGNRSVRKAGVPIEWDGERIAEFAKCAEDPEYFIRTYCYIKNVDSEELILLEPRSYQREMLEKMLTNRNVIIKLPRQCGKTSMTSAVLLWHLIFMRNFSILVAAHKRDKANDVITSIREMYELLPEFLQHGVEEWNKGSFKLETGSRIRAAATSASSARGDVYNMVYLDEFAFVPTHIAEEFVKSVIPTVSSGKTSKIFITSTPKGLNMFYNMWKSAVDGTSGYAWVEIKWNDVPGRDEEFRKSIVSQFGQEYFDQEYGAEFLGSSRTLIAGSKLLTMRMRQPIVSQPNIRVYDHPQKGSQYAVTVDVSEGLGGDYTVVSVFDITRLPYRLAAIYRNNLIPVMAVPAIVDELGRRYNDAMVLVETNFGSQVADILWTDLEYPTIVMTARKGLLDKITGGFGSNARPGIAFNKQSKRQGCTTLKNIVEQDQLLIEDSWAYDELCRFAVSGQSYAAEEGNDDVAMTLVMFAWLVDQGYVRDTTDVDIRKKIAEINAQAIEEEMMPLGFRRDGSEDDDLVAIEIDYGHDKNRWDNLFDKHTARKGMSELELHDKFMSEWLGGWDMPAEKDDE